jgi:hypothetical protein
MSMLDLARINTMFGSQMYPPPSHLWKGGAAEIDSQALITISYMQHREQSYFFISWVVSYAKNKS